VHSLSQGPVQSARRSRNMPGVSLGHVRSCDRPFHVPAVSCCILLLLSGISAVYSLCCR
jgi:hypothetical protein